jgi:RNase P subunit RPR2
MKMDSIQKKYACPMHPEIKGKFNEKCTKCNMSLTIPVAKNAQK